MRELYKVAIVILVLLNLLEILTKINMIHITFYITIFVGILGLNFIDNSFRKISFLFFSLGSFLLIAFNQPINVWMTSFDSMTNFISILVIMQLFTIPITIGKYNNAIRYQLERFCNGEKSFYLFTMLVTHVLSSVLSMGAVPIVIALLEDTLKKQVRNYKWFIATSISRSFTLGTLWAPGAATIFLLGNVTGVSWPKIFFPSLLLGVSGLILSYYLEIKQGNISAEVVWRGTVSSGRSLKRKYKNKIWHIIIAIILLIILTMAFINCEITSASQAIILSGCIVSALWMFLLKQESDFKSGLKKYWEKDLLKAADLAPFFIAIGFFSEAFQQSGLEHYLEFMIQGYVSGIGIWVICLIPLIMIVLSLVGFHPLISVVLFGKILMIMHLPIPTITIALCLNVGSSISYMMSPFAGIIMTIAKFINAKAANVGFYWNWLFCIFYFVIGVLMAYYWGIEFT